MIGVIEDAGGERRRYHEGFPRGSPDAQADSNGDRGVSNRAQINTSDGGLPAVWDPLPRVQSIVAGPYSRPDNPRLTCDVGRTFRATFTYQREMLTIMTALRRISTEVWKRIMPRLLVVMLVLLLAATACARDDTPTPVPTVDPTPTATPVPSPTPSPVSTPKPTPPPTATPTPEPTPTFVSAPVILPTATFPFGTPTPLPGDPLSWMLDGIELRVNVLRDLSSQRAVDRELITRGELGKLLLEIFEEEREEILRDQRLYATLGILQKGTDLFDLLLGLYGEGVLGFYRAEEEKFYVVRDSAEFGPQQERTYVHEFIHALQQQHYDFDATFDELEGNSDASAALSALVEGDARLAETAYIFEYLDEVQRAESEGQASDALISAFRAAPHVIQRQYLFPYVEGFNFAISLYRKEGWESMSQAFVDIPQSTEQILHPEKYSDRDEPIAVELPDLVETLGEGWSLDRNDTFGEFLLQAYMESGISRQQAALAADGWGGDAFSLLVGPLGETLLVLSIVWDTEIDAREFHDTFVPFTALRTGGRWETGDGASLLVLDDQVVLIGLDATSTVVIFAPDADVLANVLMALAAGDGRAETRTDDGSGISAVVVDAGSRSPSRGSAWRRPPSRGPRPLCVRSRFRRRPVAGPARLMPASLSRPA